MYGTVTYERSGSKDKLLRSSVFTTSPVMCVLGDVVALWTIWMPPVLFICCFFHGYSWSLALILMMSPFVAVDFCFSMKEIVGVIWDGLEVEAGALLDY